MLPASADVVVVGGGNAALCAALAAREHGVSVLVLERAPREEAGGNSRFTAGAMRCVYDGVDDLKALMPDLTADEIAQTDFGTYTEDQFFDDMYRVTEYRTDPDLAEILVKRSRETLRWMRSKGVRFAPIWGRQAFKVDGRFKFWGGLTVESHGGGPGLVNYLTAAAEKNGITILYDTRAVGPRRGRRRRAGAARPARGQDRHDQDPQRRARRGRLPGQRRMAHALHGAGLGARQGARHPLQHRRRHQDGARRQRHADGQLVGRPRGRLGPQRAGVRRPLGRRQLPEAQLPVQPHDQRQRRALRRRGGGFPQLHLRQVRPRDPDAAGPVLLAGVRQEGAPPPARRVPHQAHHQGVGRHARGAVREARGRQCRQGARRPSRPSMRR